ncbi:MAG: hypothetical protein JKY42_08830 [Flavobacteriales bacterium]|nr:hypothetical protein [Flavobacteriales bacterium]
MEWSEEKRLRRLSQVLGALLITSLLLSRTLWVSGTRLFPKSPIAGWLPELPFVIELLAFLVVICSAFGLVVRPKNVRFILPLLIVSLLLCAFDQLRIQPWLYLYLLLLAPIYVLNKSNQVDQLRWLFSLLRFSVIALYVWSGIHKINPEYWGYTHAFIVGPVVEMCPDSWSHVWKISGYVAPFIEVILGLLLFLSP